jgi:hypothetical protein
VVYFNHSPDTLKQLWFKLYPNLYKKGVKRKTEIAEADLGPGVKLLALKVNGHPRAVNDLVVEGTNMHLGIAALPPGSSIKLTINYSYTLNKGSSIRTGQVNAGSFFVAYFFPRIAVYDDVHGWNKIPYEGPAEFYNDFGDFEAAISVPKNYMVWATGDLLNAGSVLDEAVAGRLARAEQSEEVIDVIRVADLKHAKVTSPKAVNTWQFRAKGVTDFVFALSNNYVMKSTSVEVDPATGRRTRVDAVFDPEHKNYEEVIDFARKTVYAMSYNFPQWPFPDAHVTVFDGLDEMEYPMMVNANPAPNRHYASSLVVHEIFHAMFPFYVGTNETKAGWMDEGWATLAEWIITPLIDSTFVGGAGVDDYAKVSGTGQDKTITTLTYELDRGGDFNTYIKPTIAYFYLKDYLGDELFGKALRHYITQWQGKHPVSYDFFHCMNEVTGKNLDWFWKAWFFEAGAADLAITAVTKQAGGYLVEIKNKGTKPLPIDLIFTYADGSTDRLHRSIGVWEQGNESISIRVNTTKPLKDVKLLNPYVADKEKSDNVFEI